MRKLDVVVLGGINSDFIVRGGRLPCPGESMEGKDFYSGAGGKGANQAVAAARLGARVGLIGAVGKDERGSELLRKLSGEKINTQYVTRKAGPTGAAVIAVDERGEKQIAAAMGANLALTVRDIDGAEKLISSCSVLLMQFESPMPCLIKAARIAKRAGARVVLDPAPARPLPKALAALLYAIRPNSNEAEELTGIPVNDRASARKAAQKFLGLGIELVVLEAGEEGDLLVTAKEEHLFPRLKVKSVDATGAGDAFAAGLSVGLAEGLSLREMGRLANATAALATTKVGAQEGLPSRRAVERLLRANAQSSKSKGRAS
jgi:ribokinase